MARKSKESNGLSKGVTEVKKKSFDAELDALFKTAASSSASSSGGQVVAPISKKVNETAAKEQGQGDKSYDLEDEFNQDDGDGELSSIESDAVISGISEDESGDEGGEEGEKVPMERNEANGLEDEEEDGNTRLVHETVTDPSLLSRVAEAHHKSVNSKKKRKTVLEEPQTVRDARSLFVGNLPIQVATSKSSIKNLKKHLINSSPYPTITKVESIRFRSIPFSKPTDDFEARDPTEAEEKYRKRQRTQQFKDKLSEEAERSGAFLSGSQKRKVAFINQEVNDKADSVNAYVTLSLISSRDVEVLKSKEDKDVSRLTAPALAALLAASVNGTLFEERHLRADLVVPLLPSEILETGLTTVKTADGSLLGASAGATSIDNESRKRTIFVGNLDFEAKEEELRGFFESLLTKEMGSPPEVKALDFNSSTILPLPETRNEDDQAHRLASWVFGVRIIRDAATQMGKGFGYVRFLNASCVDEIMAMHESEQNTLAAVKVGKSLGGEFKRKLKFKGRPLRVSRCKVAKGNVTASPVNPNKAITSTPKRITVPIPHRSRSSGAPTPGGSSPFLRADLKGHDKNFESPTRKSKIVSTTTSIPNPKPLSSDPLKIARNAQKRADAERQAKRLAKKERKRAEIRGTGEKIDKSKIKLKVGRSDHHTKGGGKFKKSSKSKKNSLISIGKLAALSVLTLLSLMVQSTNGNNEIVNFGPVLCRADEVGHLEDKVARKVSQSWPSLSSSSNPTLFSINPYTQQEGVWLVLAIDEGNVNSVESNLEDDSAIITPEHLATSSFPLLTNAQYDKDLTPRDRWLRNTKNDITWFFTRRFTFRVTWPPNFPINVNLKVHTARSMLTEGNIKWTANEKDMRSVQEDDDIGGIDVPSWPCPRLYLHLKSTSFGVPIPPRQSLANYSWLHRTLSAITEAYIGPLVSDLPDIKEAAAATPIPVHLVLEPLILGFIPQTALTLLAVLVPTLTFISIFVLPRILAKFKSISNEDQARLKID